LHAHRDAPRVLLHELVHGREAMSQV
jgi:hypothetical protein